MLQHLQKVASASVAKTLFRKGETLELESLSKKGSVLQLIGLRINVRDCR